MTITDVLNAWNQFGVFSYVIPFLLIFAVVFAILDKTKILGDKNRPLLAIVSASVGLLALQMDFVSEFFAVIFPRFGIGLSVFLVLVIILGFFFSDSTGKPEGAMKWIGWVVGIGVAVWALTSWSDWRGYPGWGLNFWLQDYFWPLIIVAAVIGVIAWVVHKDKDERGSPSKSEGKKEVK